MDLWIACASKPSRAVIGSGSSKSDYGSCTASTPNEQFAAIRSSSEHTAVGSRSEDLAVGVAGLGAGDDRPGSLARGAAIVFSFTAATALIPPASRYGSVFGYRTETGTSRCRGTSATGRAHLARLAPLTRTRIAPPSNTTAFNSIIVPDKSGRIPRLSVGWLSWPQFKAP